MAIPLTIDGNTYDYPQQGDVGYATQATGWAQAANGAIVTAQNDITAIEDKPFLLAYRASSNVTGISTATTVIFNTVSQDTASAYDNTTGVYTVPATGTYLITTSLATTQASSTGNQVVKISHGGTVAAYGACFAVTAGGANGALNATAILSCVANDTLYVTLETSAGTCGYLLSTGTQLAIKRLV